MQSIKRGPRSPARTKRNRRNYGAGEWGRNRVRVFPDPKTGILQIEWRENGRRLTRSLGHRDWVRAKRQADEFAAGFAGPELNGRKTESGRRRRRLGEAGRPAVRARIDRPGRRPADRASRQGPFPVTGQRPMPHRGVKTTWRVVSRIGPPAIHTGLSVDPLARSCLRPRGPAARCRTGRIGRGGRTPLAEGSVRRRGERVFTRLPSASKGSLPQHRSVPEGCRAPLRGPAADALGRPAGRWAVRHRRPRPGRDPSRLAVSPSRKGLLARERPHGRLGWPCTSQPSPCRVRHAEHMGRSRQRA